MTYLDAVEAELNRISPGMQGKLWERTPRNALDLAKSDVATSWILQVPGFWGWNAQNPVPKGEEKPGVKTLLVKIQNNIANAKRTVDITGFGVPSVIGSPAGPFPDGNFLDAICAGLTLAAVGCVKNNTRLTVRFLTGVLSIDVTADPWGFYRELKERVGKAAADVIDFRIASMTTRGMTSYNHSKLVIVDGESVIHGGINWMTNYYIEDGPFLSKGYGDKAPVTDLDIALRGPAAASAGRFLDELWEWTLANGNWVRTAKPRPGLRASSPPPARTGRCTRISRHPHRETLT
jgi:phosphatidylserine/phosphatidylglycerophosphate/cardiolipin synthase-like enzyme